MTASTPMFQHIQSTALALFISLPMLALAVDAPRQAEVARLGAEVMPFSLQETTHIFSQTADGGTQRVVAKNPADTRQVQLVRTHLRDIQARFLRGDFAGPAHIHGDGMAGLHQLMMAPPGQIGIDYQDVEAGAELRFRSADAGLVSALHAWFDAQLADHGADAMAGHPHSGHAGMQHQ